MRLKLGPWLLPASLICSVAGFVAVLIGGFYLIQHQRHQERRQRMRTEQAIKTSQSQIRYAAYILCRSEGRTPRQCKAIAHGAVLPAQLTLEKIKAEVATLGEATVTKLFVGVPGRRGRVGLGKRGGTGPGGSIGPQGRTGKDGKRGRQGPAGASGPQGAQGARGPGGSNGPEGPRGPVGPQGPPGDRGLPGSSGPAGPAGVICPGLTIKTIFIPSAGTFKIPICP